MTVETVTKSEICRRFGWTRYEFDRFAASGMPVAEAARHKGAEWRVDPRAVARWLAAREAREADRHRLAREQREARLREEAERAARAAERSRAAEHVRVADFVTMWLYAEFRWKAAASGAEWPSERPSWWRLPPDVLIAAVEAFRPYLTGKANARPPTKHLLSVDVDYTKSWPWRADAEAAT